MASDSAEDVTDRLVLARMGWCEFYNGTKGDEPVAGGEYNDNSIGSEWNNFRVIKGRVYGYVHPTVVPVRITGSRQDSLNDVAVALFAKNPDTAGQYLVGWHRHVQINDPIDYRGRPEGDYGVYLWSCGSSDAVLLPKALRSLSIPKGKGGTGQAQVTYARDADGRLKKAPWLKAVRKFILNYDGPSLTGADGKTSSATVVGQELEGSIRGQGILKNALLRKAVEAHAMRRVKAVLTKRYGNDPADLSASESFDFLCRSKGKTLHPWPTR
jgi:hypothetical protein